MARINTYDLDDAISPSDKVIGSDGDNLGATKNFTVQKLTEHINSALDLTPATFLGWVRYNGTETFVGNQYVTLLDGESLQSAMLGPSLVKGLSNWDSNNAKLVFNQSEIDHTFVLTVVFKASAANANSTHVDIEFISGGDYHRLEKSCVFAKGNSVVQNFHELFQFYVDQDLIDNGLTVKITADGGTVLVGDVIYFLQKTQSI